MKIHYTYHATPIGRLMIAASNAGLHAIEFPQNRHPVKRDGEWIEAAHPLHARAIAQLDEYFAGTRKTFDLPLTPHGTPFQLQVWDALRKIPYGQTWSYARLAQTIGKPSAVRAVGAANGRNPLPIVVPCHRVIGANGSMTGFGGGVPTKEHLLRLEGAVDKK